MRRVAFITDIHFDEKTPADFGVNTRENWNRIISDLKAKGISEIVFGGDIGEQSSHKFFFNSLKDFSVNVILGNHDKFAEIRKIYNPYNKSDELYYSLVDDYNKYLFLDSSSGKLSKKQLDWVENSADTEKVLTVFIHHPIIEVNTILDKRYCLENRETLKAVFKSLKQPVTIFCGHYHTNDEKQERNLYQFVTQSSSFQVEKNTAELNIKSSEFCYRIIEISKGIINSEVVTFKKDG